MSILLILLSFLFFAPSLNAQPAVNYSDFKNSVAGDVTSLTVSNVQVVGSNRGLAVCVHLAPIENNNERVSTVVFNTSESLTFVAQAVDGNTETEWWYLSNASATTADVVITFTSSIGASSVALATAIGLSNAAQAQPTLSNNANCLNCTVETVGVTTTVNNTLLLACARHNFSGTTLTFGAGQTKLSGFGESGGTGEATATSHELKDPLGFETQEVTSSFGGGDMSLVVIGVEPFVSAPPATRRRGRNISPR